MRTWFFLDKIKTLKLGFFIIIIIIKLKETKKIIIKKNFLILRLFEILQRV